MTKDVLKAPAGRKQAEFGEESERKIKTSADTGHRMRLAYFERKRSGRIYGRTYGRTYRRRDKTSYRDARTHLKKE